MTEPKIPLEVIFSRALQIADATERGQFIEQACDGNAELQQRVIALLKAAQEAGSFLEFTSRTVQLPTEFEFPFLKLPRVDGDLGSLGPYRILNRVGRGGMGIVFRAFDPKLQRVVAVKVLAPEIAVDPMARKRFEREARSAAAVSHPNCVVIYSVDEAHNPPYLVMEYIQGKTLADKITATGALPLKETLRIGSQIAEGLAAAHKQGLVHRDIKPANVLLENGVERAKVTDFGLAKTIDDVPMTRTGEFSGTPQYMSPEQASGGMFDHRTDLFSLGAILYTMCTGSAPFRASNPLAVLKRICEDNPRPIQAINRETPDWLCAVIDRLLAKSPANRFQSAAEVAEILQTRLAELHGVSIAHPAPALKLLSAWNQQPWRWPILALGLMAAVAAMVWMAPKQSPRGAVLARVTKNESTPSKHGEATEEPHQKGLDIPHPDGATKSMTAEVSQSAEIDTSHPFNGTSAGDSRELTAQQIAYRWCPPGHFTMGSPRSEMDHGLDENLVDVTLTRGFWMQETEVTQGQWKSVMETTPWKVNVDVMDGPDYPASFVSQFGYESAAEYCVKLTDRELAAGRLPVGWKFRLPTEAEWEYACRAGTESAWSFGNDKSLLSEWAWWGANDDAGNARRERWAHPVGLLKANDWGLKDMHGNLWEWCADFHLDTLPGGVDPLVKRGRGERSFRGGSWLDAPTQCRSACRGWCPPNNRNFSLGFRTVASMSH